MRNSQNEAARAENLRDYNVLYSERDPGFDSITKLAAMACQTPAAVINFIDSDLIWIKSSYNGPGITTLPREGSFCNECISQDDVMVVEDALKDERFHRNPHVIGKPHLRFYAGVSIKTAEGFHVGSLCVVAFEPLTLSEAQKETLKLLSTQVSELMNLRKANRDLEVAQAQLQEQQELLINKARHQTIGELAGGICHQINNPLAIIVGRAMILRSRLREGVATGELLKELDVIDETSIRISGILKALRSYSRDLGQEVVIANVNEIIEDALTLMRSKLTTGKIEVQFMKPHDCFLRVNKNQVGQVILDLLANAVESMEEAPVKTLTIKVMENEGQVMIEVHDTGEGIPSGYESKIFEPFFTTKPRHFGVGLSNARNFLQQHKGELVLLRSGNPTIMGVKLPKNQAA